MQNLVTVPESFLHEMMERLVRTECKLTALMTAKNLDNFGRPLKAQHSTKLDSIFN